MAPGQTPTTGKTAHTHSLSVIRVAVAAGISAAVVFVLCWVGTFIPFSSPTHAYITLFSNADVNSSSALIEGTSWSLLFGALVGLAFALIYNAASALDRR